MGMNIWGPTNSINSAIEIINVKDSAYGAVGDGTTDDTAAIVAANTAAVAAGKRLWFPKGTYVYKPTGILYIEDWYGEGMYASILSIDTSSYSGTIFRCAESMCPSQMQFKQKDLAKIATCLDFSAADTNEFTGHFTLSEVYVQGFNKGVNINNVFMLTAYRCRFETNMEGVYCAPVDAAGDNGYINAITFYQCWAWQNTRNYYFSPALVSVCITFIGGNCENATGAAEQSYFTNIRNLTFIDYYWEGASTIPAIRIGDVSMCTLSGRFNDSGGVVLGTNAEVVFDRVYTTAPTDVVTGANGTQKVAFHHCGMRSSGNSAVGDYAQFFATSTDYNGTSYKAHANNFSVGIVNETYSASITPNLRFGNIQYITVTNGTAFTINAPTNAISGTKLTLTLRNTSGGAMGAVTWDAVFKLAAWTSPANGFSRSITFYYNGTNWIEKSRTAADVPN